MLAIVNRTPYVTALVPGLDKEGAEHVTLVIKGTFVLREGGPLRVADEQAPIVHADVYNGKPETSSLRHEADTALRKRGTDVVLLGHVHSPRPAPQVDVMLAVGPLRKAARVFGDRVWQVGALGPKISEPQRFTKVPLLYENAFGGVDRSDPDQPVIERRNPVGRGLFAGLDPARAEGVPLPNIEDPEHLVTSPTDRPRPVGFGPIARSWTPRLELAGTYDAAWREERCPFLPADFDERFFQFAPPDLVTPRPLRGGEPVHLVGFSAAGDLHFQLPAVRLAVGLTIKGARVAREPVLDAVVIEPDSRRLVLTWRLTEPCPRTFLYIKSVDVREAARTA